MGTVRMRIALFACLLTLLSASHAFAQITAATISGTVNDESAGVLPGVTIEVKNLDTGLTRSVVTDGNGLLHHPRSAARPRTRSRPACRLRQRGPERHRAHRRPASGA